MPFKLSEERAEFSRIICFSLVGKSSKLIFETKGVKNSNFHNTFPSNGTIEGFPEGGKGKLQLFLERFQKGVEKLAEKGRGF